MVLTVNVPLFWNVPPFMARTGEPVAVVEPSLTSVRFKDSVFPPPVVNVPLGEIRVWPEPDIVPPSQVKGPLNVTVPAPASVAPLTRTEPGPVTSTAAAKSWVPLSAERRSRGDREVAGVRSAAARA